MSDNLLTVSQVMELLRVSRMTVHRRIQSGQLKPVETPSSALERKSNMRFRREEVEKLLHSNEEEQAPEPENKVA